MGAIACSPSAQPRASSASDALSSRTTSVKLLLATAASERPPSSPPPSAELSSVLRQELCERICSELSKALADGKAACGAPPNANSAARARVAADMGHRG